MNIAAGGRSMLADFLLIESLVQQKELQEAYEVQTKDGLSLEQALIKLKVISDRQIAEVYSKRLQIPMIELENLGENLDPSLTELIPEKFLRDNHILPFCQRAQTLFVAMANPADLVLHQEVQIRCGLTPVVHVAPLLEVEEALERMFGTRNMVREIMLEVPAERDEEDVPTDEDFLDLDRPVLDTKDTRIIRMVNQILVQAISERTSDIHFEPLPEEASIRFRIDGALRERPAPPKQLYVPLISRLKILSKMDIAEKRLPQDGAFSVRYKQNDIDMRVSTVPTVFGEKMVIRILNKNAMPVGLENLGFDERQQESFVSAARSPHGLIFVTGPTGSGKSTTLYGVLNLLMSKTKNIVTAEDPVEYKLPGINQVHVRSNIGLTFASVLRTFLRQDPDIIMVGEVRDQETAQICMRAALTGHLVLSTLHTNDALSAITRLQDMGIEPFLLSASLRVVEAQRLVRRLCNHCKEPYKPDAQSADKYGLLPEHELFRAKGCEHCNQLGYSGRVGIFEVIRITPVLRDLIQDRAPIPDIQKAAEAEGMNSLLTSGLQKVREGITTIDEVVSTAQGGGH